MKTLLSFLIVFQFVFFNSTVYAITCKQALTTPQKTTPLIKSVKKAGRNYLDTSRIPGLENVVFEQLSRDGMVTAKNGAFTCTHCGTLHKIEEVPKDPEIECENCAQPVVMNQKVQPPMIVIRHNNQIYVSEHNIVRNKAVVEYFEEDAVGCATCDTVKLEADKSCTNCGDTTNVEIETPPVREIKWSSIKRNPRQIYPDLIKMGLMDPVFARSKGYLSSKQLFDIAKDLMSDGQLELAGAIKRGLVDPKEAVKNGWVTLSVRRFAMDLLLNEGFVSISTVIVKGWMEKAFAVEKGYISQSEADQLRVEMTPYEMFQTAEAQIKAGDIDLSEAIRRELVDPKLSLEEGWIKLKDRREAVLKLINEGYILVEDALKKGWMVKDFAITQGLIEPAVAAQIKVPVVQGKSLKIQAQHRNEDFGEEGPIHTRAAGEDNFTIPAFRDRVDQPFSLRNIAPVWKKVISIGVTTAIGVAVTGAVLLKEHAPATGPIAFGEVVNMSESMIIYENQEIKDQYGEKRFNIENPPEGVRVITGELSAQIRPSEVEKEETEQIGQIMSVMVLDVNDAQVKIYKQGSVTANFSDFEIGERVPIEAVGMFEYKLSEESSQ